MTEYVELTLDYVHHTDDAILVDDGDQEIWLPLSQCKVTNCEINELEKGDTVFLDVAEWLAQQRGLI